ncbi:Nn.00g108460.m01.CDS01 [Neocucurbitaria sp. VM-36]
MKVISYGETAVSFIFPLPDIITTASYWSGVYPTVTGPLPSDLQTIPLTTRTNRQTPLSALPSFRLFSSRPSRFRTVVTTIFEEDDEATQVLVKRDEVTATITVQGSVTEVVDPMATITAAGDPEPTLCGESGNFTLTFDDTVVGNDDNLLLVANGMKNPYHHLFYANGFTYVPDKWEPYPAISQPNVAMFLPLAGRLLPNTPFAGTLLPGELGAGPRASVNAYWFNAYSAYFGCGLNGIMPCTLRISGYRYDPILKEEVLVVEQNATIPACWGYINCRLTRVLFSDDFRALSGIQFNAYTYNLGIPQVHMMDDLQMEWYNNTCSAGILRIGHR